jgi:hypothetical protein
VTFAEVGAQSQQLPAGEEATGIAGIHHVPALLLGRPLCTSRCAQLFLATLNGNLGPFFPLCISLSRFIIAEGAVAAPFNIITTHTFSIFS